MRITLNRFQIDVYQAGNPDALKYALVLPGLLDTKDYPHMHSHVDMLAQKGFFAMSIDLPGTWGSSGTIADFTITNCLAVIHELIQTHAKPTLLVGHSNGGRLALLAAHQNDEVRAVATLMSPLEIYRDDPRSDAIQAWKQTGVRVSERDIPGNSEGSRTFNLPFSFLKDSETYNTKDILPTLTIPKLFIAGGRDSLILPSEVERMYDLAVEPKELCTVDVGHNYRKRADTIALVNEQIELFLKTKASF